MNLPRRTFLLVAATALLPVSASAAPILFDNFNSYPTGPLNGQGPVGNVWTALAGATVADSGGGDHVANLVSGTSTIPNYRSLTPAGLDIPNSSAAATVYWNFTISAAGAGSGNNWNFVITDDAAPTNTGDTSEVQFNYDSTASPAGLFRARQGGVGFKFLSTTGGAAGDVLPVANSQYNVWFLINNSTDIYQVYMQSDSTPALAMPTQLLANDGSGGDFTFRNGAAANALTTVNIGSNSPTSVVRMDDIYVDTEAFNLTNPVPEPSALGLVALGVAGLVARRRLR